MLTTFQILVNRQRLE